jgi:glyoxylase-like metal-dependent hydrolase (beta-lactamase superfamily II)
MRHATRWILPASLALTGVLATTSTFAVDLPALQKAATALGTNNLRSIEYSGSGFDYALGQAFEVDKAWPKFNDKTYTRVVSFEPWATQLKRTRTQFENPARGGGGQPIAGEQNQTQVVAAGTPAAATVSDDLALQLPQAFIRAAVAAKDTAAKAETKNGKTYQVVSFTALNKATTRGWINSDGLVERVETKIDNPALGDIVYEVAYENYKDFNGIKFPAHIVQQQAGHPVLDIYISDVKTNVPADIQAAAPAAPPTPLASEKLSNGVYLITGGYAAIAVDLKDHILIIEGGQNDQRSETVINEAKRLFPGKPVGELVNTHAHVDHLGGVRAYVAEGTTIITHASNKAYYEKIWANPHTIAPDKLALNPKPAKFKLVKDELTIGDADHVVKLYHEHGFGHHAGALFAYLPKEKILIEADAFNPPATAITQTPATVSSFNQNLVANIERLKLSVDRIIPIHLPADGRKVSLAELYTAVGKSVADVAKPADTKVAETAGR